MISNVEKKIIDNVSKDSLILLNGHLKWSFLDDYLFSEMIDIPQCSIKRMYADGNVINEKKESNDAARLFVFWHKDLKQWSSTLCILGQSNQIIKSYNITSIAQLA